MENTPPLNPEQDKVSRIHNGPVLVIAGAGTGKTRTLVYRLVRLIESGTPPQSILLLTFTRRAAQEMISRASELLGGEHRLISGGTFHSFANSMLRRYGQLGDNNSEFSVLDQADSLEIISNIRTEMNLAERGRRFPRRETIAAMLSKMVNKQEELADVLQREYPHFTHELTSLESMAQSYSRYKAEHRFMDFDDLLVKLVELFDRSAEAKERICERYPYVMVDEYQDTNLLQALIARHLGHHHKNIMVVGDEAQSIYAFRGANYENLFDFQRSFTETETVKLEQNYRSTQPILDLSNALLSLMSKSFRKDLFTERSGDQKPKLVRVSNEMNQAAFIANEIRNLVDAGTNLAEIAILFRASHHSYQLEVELGRFGIPFVKYGGFKFMETAHIKDVLSHLRVLDNPADDLSLTRILMLCEGIGRVGARKIRQFGADKDLLRMLKDYPAKGEAKTSIQELAALMNALSSDSQPPSKALEDVIDYYGPKLELKYDDWPKRKSDLKQVVAISKNYRSMKSMLTDMTLDPPNSARNGSLAIDENEGELVLSTIHSAKGLEWKVVFIIQVANGSFPMIKGFGEVDMSRDELDEELRLLYVAVTRAKDELYLVCPQSTGKTFNLGVESESPFIKALPPEIFQQIKTSSRRYYNTFS